MLVIEIDSAALNAAATRFLVALSQGAQRALRAEAETTRERIVGGAYWTNRTGKTAASFKVEQGQEDLSATLRSGSKVARFLLNGTPPHTITPRRRDALRFVPAGGGVVFTKRVRHPGTKPRPFISTEAANAEPRLAAATERAAESAASTAGLG